MTDARYVIGISGPVGAGKSTLAAGVAKALADAAVLQFDHYEQITEQPISDIRQWMEEGADLDAIRIPGLAQALHSLKEGVSVIDPLTGAAIGPCKYILFETQFGRQHTATGRYIDLMVWVDTPLDVALARKVRQFASGAAEDAHGAAGTFASWLRDYLDNYLEVVGNLLRMQKKTVGAGADLAVDGEREPVALRDDIVRLIRERLP